MTAWATADTFAIGDKPTAAQLNEVTGDLNLLGGSWIPYTPTWGGTGVSLGNGTLTAAYQLIDRTLRLRIVLIAGTTTNWGSGLFTFTLPPGLTSTGVEQHGTAKCTVAGTNYGGCYSYLPASSTTIRPFGPSLTTISSTVVATGAAQQMDNNHPAAFGSSSSNSIALGGTFEVA